MPYTGHCNCGSVQVSLPEKPTNTLACHCKCCRRAGGPYSINYLVDQGGFDLQDTRQTLKKYQDKHVNSGNDVTRQFCGSCGSPVATISSAAPTKVFLKASLFDTAPPVSVEVFTDRRESWAESIRGAEQK